MPPATSGLENNPPDDIVNHIESNESTHSNVRSVPSSPLSNQSQRFYTIEEVQEIVNDMQKLKIEPEKSQRLPSASLFADVAQPPVAISRVPYAEYVTTTTAQSKVLESIRFSNSGSTNKDQLKQFKLSLIESRLLPLAKGNRLQPICSTANTFGYTDDTIVTTDGKSILIPKDDFAKWSHENDRLCSILNLTIKSDLHYLFVDCMEQRQGSVWYLKLVEHIHGTTNSDIRKARKVLDDLVVSTGKPIKENLAQIEDAITNFNTASNSIMSETDKLYWLQEKLNNDKRIPVQGFMAAAKSEDLTYQETVRRLILVDPAIVPAQKMAALSTTHVVELCQRHIRGVCTNGASCKYSHGPITPATATIPSRKTPTAETKKDNLRKSDDKFPRTFFKKPIVVSSEHRHTVGLPRRKSSTKNPGGFSHKQLAFIYQLQSNDAWSSGDTAYFGAPNESNLQQRFNMLHVEDEESQFAAVPISVIPKSDLISPHTSYNIIQEHEPSDRDFVALLEDEENDAAADSFLSTLT